METIKLKCPSTITGMVNALSRKYKGVYINITKQHSNYGDGRGIVKSYSLYIASNISCEQFTTFSRLRLEVGILLHV